jgi:hypothetical protein
MLRLYCIAWSSEYLPSLLPAVIFFFIKYFFYDGAVYTLWNHYRMMPVIFIILSSLLYINCCVHVTRGTVSHSHMGLAVFTKDRTSLQLRIDFSNGEDSAIYVRGYFWVMNVKKLKTLKRKRNAIFIWKVLRVDWSLTSTDKIVVCDFR